MNSSFENEVSKAIQYFLILLAALFVPLINIMLGADAINIGELWKGMSDYLAKWF